MKEIIITEDQMLKYLSESYVAVAFDKNAEFVDAAFTWVAAQNLANMGYRLIAIADEQGYMSKKDIQAICDYELKSALDCFGEDYQK